MNRPNDDGSCEHSDDWFSCPPCQRDKAVLTLVNSRTSEEEDQELRGEGWSVVFEALYTSGRCSECKEPIVELQLVRRHPHVHGVSHDDCLRVTL